MSTEGKSSISGEGKSTLAPKMARQSSGNSKSRISRGGLISGTSSRRTQRSAAGTNSLGAKTNSQKPPLQLLDAQGADVTPRSLIDPTKRPTTDDIGRRPSEAFALGGGADRSVIWGTRDNYRTVAEGTTAFPNFNKSTRGSAYSIGNASMMMSMLDDFGDELGQNNNIVAGLSEVQTFWRSEKEELQDADLNKPIPITLTETDTISLLDLQSKWAPADTDEATLVQAENQRREAYDARISQSRESLSDHGTQTLGLASKHKEIQVSGSTKAESGTQSSTADLADTYAALLLQESSNHEQMHGKSSHAITRRAISAFFGQALTPLPAGFGRSEIVQDPLAQHAPGINTRELGFGIKQIVQRPEKSDQPIDFADVAQLPSFVASLRLTERLVAHTLRHLSQQQYRREENALASLTVGQEPCVRSLWTYTCNRTDGRAASCMSWNKHNSDIVAVGYGSLEFATRVGGIACCWSIKNPEYPERIYTLPSPVTSIDFAAERPSLLAVGLQDGNIFVFDISSPKDTPLLDTRDRDVANKHSQAVWELQWVVRERMIGEERGEMLVSAGADGRVLQWSLQRGLEHTEVMLARRVGKESAAGEPIHKGNVKTAFMARTATVMALDFIPDDHNKYLIATEDGALHRCSCSYNEQFLGSYTGHTGAIYRLRCNPLEPSTFLTCSADWSIKLWTLDCETPLISLQPSTSPILSATWSPYSPSVLASISGGTVNVWDLSVRSMDPIISTRVTEDSQLTTVMFSSNADAILTGDTMGRVNVHLLCNMPVHSESMADQRKNFLATLQKGK